MTGSTPPPSAADAATIPVEGLERAEFRVPAPPPFRVRVQPGVHESVWNHGRESVEVELCGVLLGRMLRDDAGPHLRVEDWVRGEHARCEGTQVTFTHATWEHIHSEIRRRHPKGGVDIVGWYHTHPGFGIFLSEMDMFIHTNFFSAAGQVALVLDPKSGEEGMFGWVKGKVERLPAFWVGDRRVGGAPPPEAPSWAAPAAGAPGPAEPVHARGGDEIDVAGSLGRIRFATVMALLWGLLLGWLASGLAGSWQLSSAVRDAARAEVAGLVRAEILAGAQAEELRGLSRRVANVASTLPGDPPAAAGAPPGPRATLEAVAADADALAGKAAERTRILDAALSSPRTYLTTGELSRQVEAQGRQVRRIADFTELLLASGEWDSLRRGMQSGAVPEGESRRRAELLVRRVEGVLLSDPSLADVVPSLFPGLVLRREGEGKEGGGEAGGGKEGEPPPGPAPGNGEGR